MLTNLETDLGLIAHVPRIRSHSVVYGYAIGCIFLLGKIRQHHMRNRHKKVTSLMQALEFDCPCFYCPGAVRVLVANVTYKR